MKKGIKGTVIQLKESLGKEHGKIEKFSNDGTALSTSFYERVRDILKMLDELPIDLAILTQTLVGTVVSKFKACQDHQVSSTAKSLIKKWKKMAKQGGVPSGKAKVLSPNKCPPTTSISEGASVTPTDPDEWNKLPQLRRNVCAKLFTIISACKDVETFVLSSLATEIESAMNELCKGNRQVYGEKIRSLCFNLKKNKDLRENVTCKGGISAQNLVRMSAEELATSEKTKQREELKRRVQDERRLDWEEQNEDKINEMCGIKGELLQASLFTCGRCKSIKTTSTQKQTRSADEPMTVFVFCQNCGNRWKC